jgi:hypothetical protein
MKRRGLLLVTLLTLLITGLVLPHANGLSPRPPRPGARFVEGHTTARTHDPLFSDAGLRWRRCQATHWRACLLQH